MFKRRLPKLTPVQNKKPCSFFSHSDKSHTFTLPASTEGTKEEGDVIVKKVTYPHQFRSSSAEMNLSLRPPNSTLSTIVEPVKTDSSSETIVAGRGTAATVTVSSNSTDKDNLYDDDLSTNWTSSGANFANAAEWVRYQLSTATAVNAYTIFPLSGSDNLKTPRIFELRGYPDATDMNTYTVLDTRSLSTNFSDSYFNSYTGTTASDNTDVATTFYFENTANYEIYELNVTGVYGAATAVGMHAWVLSNVTLNETISYIDGVNWEKQHSGMENRTIGISPPYKLDGTQSYYTEATPAKYFSEQEAVEVTNEALNKTRCNQFWEDGGTDKRDTQMLELNTTTFTELPLGVVIAEFYVDSTDGADGRILLEAYSPNGEVAASESDPLKGEHQTGFQIDLGEIKLRQGLTRVAPYHHYKPITGNYHETDEEEYEWLQKSKTHFVGSDLEAHLMGYMRVKQKPANARVYVVVHRYDDPTDSASGGRYYNACNAHIELDENKVNYVQDARELDLTLHLNDVAEYRFQLGDDLHPSVFQRRRGNMSDVVFNEGTGDEISLHRTLHRDLTSARWVRPGVQPHHFQDVVKVYLSFNGGSDRLRSREQNMLQNTYVIDWEPAKYGTEDTIVPMTEPYLRNMTNTDITWEFKLMMYNPKTKEMEDEIKPTTHIKGTLPSFVAIEAILSGV